MLKQSKRVIISVSNDLVADQRVHKVASSLMLAGYSVLVVGRKLPGSQGLSRKYNCQRLTLLFNKGPLFYVELNIRLFLLLLFSSADIYLANDLDTLAANYLASVIRRKPLVYDSHELFTEVPELIDRPNVQKIWKQIEAFILPRVKYSYTVCQSIADYYNRKYGIDMKVVRNIPLCKPEIEERPGSVQKSIILYQGSVNIGRGVDLVIKALKFLPDAEFHVIGSGDVLDEMKELAKSEIVLGRVKFFGKIPFEELEKHTREAALGISLEENLGLNYYYALPNKLFDYIHAGVPVLGSDLPEIAGIINRYKIGRILTDRDPRKVAETIQDMFQQKEKYKAWKENLKIAATELCWQNEEKVLLSVFESVT
ncbi:MAG: glycosyltransferase [Bacteroidota bacterium]|nr:glycosyltransferase [Bacteroidota bacterium]